MQIPEIVITGGPCAGKTTALAAISEHCQKLGYEPILVPEAATQLIASGFDPTQPSFQELVLNETLHAASLRRRAIGLYGYRKPVLIYDRGLADGQAYVSKKVFDTALENMGLNRVLARDYYSGVIFLDSAANGAEQFYNTANNLARSETLQEARRINKSTLEAWHGTPHLIRVQNHPGETFEQKIHQALKGLSRILGEPEPLEIERKYRIKDFDFDAIPTTAAPIIIRQTYLTPTETGTVERVRARGQGNFYFYYHTIKKDVAGGIVQEYDRIITKDEYDRYLVRQCPHRLPIDKVRWCFTHKGHYCELDVFSAHNNGLKLLEIEVDSLDAPVELPDFLGSLIEVTGEKQFSNFALATAA